MIYNERIIGTCSLCGGAVVVPTVFWSVIPPTPRCRDCGAVPKRTHGPVIPMVPSLPNPWRYPRDDEPYPGPIYPDPNSPPPGPSDWPSPPVVSWC